MMDLTTTAAKDLPLGTLLEIPSARLTLKREHGKKPWRSAGGRYRFSHTEVDASIQAGEVKLISLGDQAVAAV